MDFDGFEADDDGAYRAGSQGKKWVHLAGAAVSLALVAGAGLWAYQLAMRDISGVPVIRALVEPMRIPPANPGGDEADYQGLSVNSVAAEGLAAPAPDRMVLAPRPGDLAPEDVPGLTATAPEVAENVPMDAPSVPLSQPAAVAIAEDLMKPDVASGPETLVEVALSEALDQIAIEAAPPAEADPMPQEVGSDPELATLRPQRRPDPAAAELAATEAMAAPATAIDDANEMDPASIPVGTRLVQLGAFDDVEGARAEWIRLAGLFGPEFAGKARVVQEAQTGGRNFIRLRAHGFEDENSARAFCTVLIARDAVCIPVAVQ